MTGYEPFEAQVAKDGSVLIRRGGRLVTTVRGAAADKLAARLGVDEQRDQALLQRATGDYRRGNERRATRP
ncbi:hypothetical protein [Homoserinibacter sp. YIM 151385]|uniref:hypothetical protein n=1 Tax=Homoserinibacter sp. YIM 151385 TaxID=2985506 RepID=UPI0022F0A566|nr:hypothetical protein [Homoserinibacter sp. YIM 151385]WBU36958.1 hypothetical protein OF852_08445 [Homoserinibacter sp. YIM 151385]